MTWGISFPVSPAFFFFLVPGRTPPSSLGRRGDASFVLFISKQNKVGAKTNPGLRSVFFLPNKDILIGAFLR